MPSCFNSLSLRLSRRRAGKDWQAGGEEDAAVCARVWPSPESPVQLGHPGTQILRRRASASCHPTQAFQPHQCGHQRGACRSCCLGRHGRKGPGAEIPSAGTSDLSDGGSRGSARSMESVAQLPAGADLPEALLHGPPSHLVPLGEASPARP